MNFSRYLFHLKRVTLALILVFAGEALGAEGNTLVSDGNKQDRRILRYNLTSGTKQSIQTTTRIKVENPALPQPMIQEQVTTLDATVKSQQKDGSWILETLTTSPMFRQFPGFDGLRAKLRMTPSGSLEVLNLEEQIAMLSRAMGSGNEQAKQIIESMSGSSSNQSLKLPTQAVGTGATWTSKTVSSMGQFGDVVLDSRYEIKRIEGDLVEIAFTGKMDFGELLNKVKTKQPVKMKLTNAEIKGTYAVHLRRPQVIGTMNSLMTMELGLPNGQSGVMKMTTSVIMREVKP